MTEFKGPIFRCISETTVVDGDVWWTTEYKVVKQFVPTAQYKKYLREKKKEEIALKISVLKHKLDMQYQQYGEVDDIDFEEYKFYVQQYSKL